MQLPDNKSVTIKHSLTIYNIRKKAIPKKLTTKTKRKSTFMANKLKTATQTSIKTRMLCKELI